MKSIRFRAEAVFTCLVAAFGPLLAALSYRLGLGSAQEPGPGFFPFFIGILTLIVGAIQLGRYAIANRTEEASGMAFGSGGIKRILGTVTFFCLWLVLMPWLGFIVVTFIVCLGFAKITGLEGWLRPLLLSFGTTLFIYFIFDVWFYTDLPRGIFG